MMIRTYLTELLTHTHTYRYACLEIVQRVSFEIGVRKIRLVLRLFQLEPIYKTLNIVLFLILTLFMFYA